jgi:hypothetical protein
MELDRPFGGFGLKVRCSASQTESWHSFQSTLIRTEMDRGIHAHGVLYNYLGEGID